MSVYFKTDARRVEAGWTGAMSSQFRCGGRAFDHRHHVFLRVRRALLLLHPRSAPQKSVPVEHCLQTVALRISPHGFFAGAIATLTFKLGKRASAIAILTGTNLL